MNEQITDAAYEIVELCDVWASINIPNAPICEGLAKSFNISVETPEFLELASVVAGRIASLREYVQKVPDYEISSRTREQITSALSHIAIFLRPQNFTINWNDIKKSNLLAGDIATLELFSAHMRQRRPLRRLSTTEREKLCTSLDQLVDGVHSDELLPEWAKAPLEEGLRRLKYVLTHLLCFGQDRAIENLIQLEGLVLAAKKHLEAGASRDNGGLPSLVEILTFVTLAFGVFAAPDQAATAIERYRGWLGIEQTKKTSEPLQLPAPVKPADNGPQDI